MSLVPEPVAAGVVRLTVPDPAALDRRDIAAAETLRDAVLTAADDDHVKVIVLAGLGAAAAPADTAAGIDPRARLLYTGVRGIHQVVTYCKKVVVVEVDGHCGATATALCLDADFVLATPQSTFASPFAVDEANVPLAVLTMRTNRTRAWMLRGNALTAAEACTADFVNEVVEPDGLRAASAALARRVSVMPLDGLTISKMNVGAAFDVVGVGREFDAVEARVAGPGGQW